MALIMVLCLYSQICPGQLSTRDSARLGLIDSLFRVAHKKQRAKPSESLILARAVLQQLNQGGQSQPKEFQKLKAYTLNLISTNHRDHGRSDSALDYALQSLAVRRQLKDSSLVGGQLINLGIFFQKQSQYVQSLGYFSKAEQIFASAAYRDSSRLAKVYGGYGLTFKDMGDFSQSLAFFQKSLAILEAKKDSNQIVNRWLNLASLYYHLQKPSISLSYINKCLSYFSYHPNPKSVSYAYNEAGNIYSFLNVVDSAYFYYNQSLQLKLAREDSSGIAGTVFNLGKLDLLRGEMDNARSRFESAMRLSDKTGDLQGKGYALYMLGVVSVEQKQGVQAVRYLKDALEIAQGQSLLTLESEIHEILSQAYRMSGNIQLSSFHLQAYANIQDSLHEIILQAVKLEDSLRQKKQLLVETEREKRVLELERQNEQTKFKNSLLISLLVLLLMMSISIVIVHRQRAKRLLAEKNQTILRLEKQQTERMVDAIAEGEERERNRLASDLHDHLGSLLSTIKLHFRQVEQNLEAQREKNVNQYETAMGLLDKAVDEVRRISHDLVFRKIDESGLYTALKEHFDLLNQPGELEAIFDFSGGDQRLPLPLEVSVFRIVQELINNVLKHAQAKTLSLNIYKGDGYLNVLLEDDGIGFDPEMVKKGLGLDLIAKRVEGLRGNFNVDSRSGRGTIISIDLPV